MKWIRKRLSECTEYITDGDHQPAPKADDGIRFIKIKDIIRNRISFDANMYVPQEYYDALPAERKAKNGDVLYTVVGSYGTPCFVDLKERFCFERNIALLHPNETIDSKFLYYAILNPSFFAAVDAIANGSAQKLIPLSKLKAMEINVPALDIQRRIADILSTYDDLIENNQKQIKLLEEAAQRLYKEWFVDLRFPGHETTPIIDGVPEGWVATHVGAICTLRKETLIPAKIPTGLPYIGLEHMPRKSICLSEWGDSSEVSSNKYAYYAGDIIFGKIRPYFHKVGFALTNGIASTDSFIMKAQNELWGLLLMVVSSKDFVEDTYQKCKEGSKMPRADWSSMRNYKILIANNQLQSLFEQQIKSRTDKIKSLALQNRVLAEARDRLLPKLMRGELEV